MKLKIKVIVGYRDDQYHVIDSEEAHKAYFLFLNPEARAVFSNGVALIGKNIQGIEPAYNETMGWNPSHKLDSDDWNDIRRKKIDVDLRDLLYAAKGAAEIAASKPEILKMSLSEATSPKTLFLP
jgi:hypothetical protein